MKTGISIAMVLLLGLSAPVWAKCVKDGVTYQTGARVGPFTCMADGQWRR